MQVDQEIRVSSESNYDVSASDADAQSVFVSGNGVASVATDANTEYEVSVSVTGDNTAVAFGNSLETRTVTSEAVRIASGIYDYESLYNKPSIEGTVLQGNKTLGDIGISKVNNQKILSLF